MSNVFIIFFMKMMYLLQDTIWYGRQAAWIDNFATVCTLCYLNNILQKASDAHNL